MRSTSLIAFLFFATTILAGLRPSQASTLLCARGGANFFVVENPDQQSVNLQTYIGGQWNRVVSKMQYLSRTRAYIGRVDSVTNLESKGFKRWSQVTLRFTDKDAHLQVRDEQALHTDRPTAEFKDLGCKVMDAESTAHRSRWIPR